MVMFAKQFVLEYDGAAMGCCISDRGKIRKASFFFSPWVGSPMHLKSQIHFKMAPPHENQKSAS